MNEKIRAVRRALNLSQKEFGEALGVSRDVLANIENNRVEPKELFVKLLCSTYNVDYDWLTRGEGEMFHRTENALADHINDLLEGENETAKALFRGLAALDESDWKVVQKFIDGIKDEKKRAE